MSRPALTLKRQSDQTPAGRFPQVDCAPNPNRAESHLRKVEAARFAEQPVMHPAFVARGELA